MPTLEQCIAVDWRAGKDRIYFFFKDTDTYARFNIGDQEVPAGYPSPVSGSWGTFDNHVKNLRFGFATTGLTLDKPMDTSDLDILWLFYYDGDTPMVCAYNQDTDSVLQTSTVRSSKWRLLLPYFDRIVAGTWWQVNRSSLFRFIMNDGNSLYLDWDEVPRAPLRDYADDKYDDNLFNPVETPIQTIRLEPITESTWPGLALYKDRIITAAQNDRTFADNALYVFLTGNQYLIYNIPQNRLVSGPHAVDNQSWPGLLRS
ncbi:MULTISPECIES: hypothetical protein [Pseudomonas]|jgi:hypothetical protein|uniref:hypothetical protein n=1 Tax=Pseudomonas TaxID=286 RepID=UPI0004882DCF|nr:MULTISPECIES: hypothetical protein [Pseudomonas]MBF6041777.1 hypothetical protein [Pseudomonas mucoides]CRL51410.1 hypothetical protein PSHI_45900 [Pseudomonas sp. URMO17WK12:I11]